MPSHIAKKSSSIRNQNDSGNTKKKEIKPPTKGRKSILDGYTAPAFRGFSKDPSPNDESEVAQENSPTPTEGIIGQAIAQSLLEVNLMEKRAEAKGKGEAALLEKEAGFEMVEKNEDDNEDDEDAVVVVKNDDSEAPEENEDDYVEV